MCSDRCATCDYRVWSLYMYLLFVGKCSNYEFQPLCPVFLETLGIQINTRQMLKWCFNTPKYIQLSNSTIQPGTRPAYTFNMKSFQISVTEDQTCIYFSNFSSVYRQLHYITAGLLSDRLTDL